jgi:hypothetical protein
MQVPDYSEIAKILQVSISPVALISGVGLIVLSQTNRFGRIVDRARQLEREFNNVDEKGKKIIKAEINILYKRSHILLLAVSTSLISIFFVSLLVITLFGIFYFKKDLSIFIVFCFVASLFSLIISVLFFITDMTLSLKALKLDIKEQIKED